MAINSAGEFTLGPIDRKEPLVVPPDFIKNLSMDTKVIAPSTSDNSSSHEMPTLVELCPWFDESTDSFQSGAEFMYNAMCRHFRQGKRSLI